MNCVDAGNVFVHLFSQTKTRYILTNKKLQYLLIVAQMARLVCGKSLFDDDIRNFKNGFVLDTVADNFVSSSAVLSGVAKNMPIVGDYSDFTLPYLKQKIFKISVLPSTEETKLLIKVFLTFGAYSEDALGAFLNTFGPLRECAFFKPVPKKKIRSFLLTAIAKGLYLNHPVLELVKSEYLEDRKKKAAVEKRKKASEAQLATQHDVKAAPSQVSGFRHQVSDEAQALLEDTQAKGLSGYVVTGLKKGEEAAKKTAAENKAVVKPETTVKKVAPEPVVPFGLLKDTASLNSIMVGKKYTVYVEVPSPKSSCEVFVIVPSLGLRLPGVLKKVSQTVYGYTFEGVASEINISAKIV